MLTEKQQRFVQCIVATGGQNATECARQAGYTEIPGKSGIRVQAFDLMHDPKVLAAIRDECRILDEGGLPAARLRLKQILSDPSHKDHFDALKWYFGVLGISPVTKSESRKVVEHTANMPALEELRQLAGQLKGIPVIDVTPKALPAPEPEKEW